MFYNRRVLAIVPILSNGDPQQSKSKKEFCGKPLYTHVIEMLDKTYAVDEILVDSNDELILIKTPELSDKIKAVKRPPELCNPSIDINMVIAHDLEAFSSDIYIQTHATNPLLKSETIANALKIFIASTEDDNCDSLFSVNKYQRRFYSIKGEAINHDPNHLVRTSELEPVFEENSILYIFTKESFQKKKNRIGTNPKMFEIPAVESIDISDEISFRLAEILALYKK